MVTGAGHPFATAGGGTLFEYKVATLVAADLIRPRLNEHGGVVEGLELQTGPPKFDDLQISLELLDGSHRIVHAQCRHRQPFTTRDGKFGTLLVNAAAALSGNETAFLSGERRFAIIVDESSPAHASLAELCELARGPGDLSRFVSVVNAHGGPIAQRWAHCVKAAGGIESVVLHRILAVLEVRSYDLRTETSRDSLELINRLAEVWDPPNHKKAVNLANALFKHITEIGPGAGAIDAQSLQTHLSADIPVTFGASTRRTLLSRLQEAGRQRVTQRLRATGLDDREASALATHVLADPPSIDPPAGITVVIGAMGVGKTTELERLHCRAIERALDDTNAPIPVFVSASEVSNVSLQSAAEERAARIGDPGRVGVHLIVDGLDEAGIHINDLATRAATLLAIWPRSTVIISSRPESPEPRLQTTVLEPLSEEAATELMKAIHPRTDRWWHSRPELTEVLRRPLFAIRYALDLRDGNLAGVHEAQLVDSVGRHAVADMGAAGDVFDLLVRLACKVVDSGGRPVDARSLQASPVQLGQIMRSRVVQAIDGRVSFQLAALTEWFAATALLRDASVLGVSMSSPLRAHRWRYVLVQALLQGSGNDVDKIMSALLTQAPATAAWVHHEAQGPHTWNRTTPPAETATEAGERVRRAARAWMEPWAELVQQWTSGGEMPTLGVAMDGLHLVTAWYERQKDAGGPVIPLPPDALPPRVGSDWTGWMIGRPRDGEMWPWDWTRRQIQRQIDDSLKNLDLLAEIPVCWPELAWDYAHTIISRSPTVRAKPILRSELEATVAKFRALHPRGDVGISRGSYHWSLNEAEDFVADLVRQGIQEIAPPWPPPNASGRWTWSFWTTDQLVSRLSLATRAALDAYGAIVEKHLPTMAPQLHTYQLLPARIVGTLTPEDPSQGFEGQPHYSWFIEPLPAGSSNEAHWRVGNGDFWPDKAEWEKRIGAVRSLRGEVAEYTRLTTHNGEPEVLSSTPAGSLALKLLVDDLSEFNWTTRSIRPYRSSSSTRPRYA